jgi:hypothetical protein
MSKINRSWMAVVVAALVLCTLVGVVWARPNDRPLAQDITRKVTLSGTDFVPASDGVDYFVNGDLVRCDAGICWFTAPVVFPCLPSVTVERIKLHVHDDSDSNDAHVGLWRTHPQTKNTQPLGNVDSPVGKSGDPETYTSADINAVVWPSQRVYVFLSLGTSVYVYGVTVEYHRNI